VSEAAEAGSLTIGVAFDRPGLSLRGPDGNLAGFEIDVATYVAGKLGVPADRITWKEAPTPQRETLITTGQVDYIVAAYTITDARKEKISFAGPYFTFGQSLLVRADETSITGPDTLDGKKLCATTGSVPAQNIKKNYATNTQLQEYDTNSACVQALRNRAIDAMTTDDIVLAGFAAASPGEFKLVGGTFTSENYGIGLARDDADGRAKINEAIEQMIADGSWAAAFEKNLGASGYPAPPAPTVARY
jgi:glutamate transport system substrate-binding protein